MAGKSADFTPFDSITVGIVSYSKRYPHELIIQMNKENRGLGGCVSPRRRNGRPRHGREKPRQRGEVDRRQRSGRSRRCGFGAAGKRRSRRAGGRECSLGDGVLMEFRGSHVERSASFHARRKGYLLFRCARIQHGQTRRDRYRRRFGDGARGGSEERDRLRVLPGRHV